MKYELKSYFGDLESKLPLSTAGRAEDRFIFSADTLPTPPDVLTTDSLYIRKAAHDYGSYRTDSLWFFAHKESYRRLGLLILSVVFHRLPAKCHIELTHPKSDIKSFIIEYEYREPEDLPGGYFTRPHVFVYWPEEVGKHPFINYRIEPYNLPSFSLTNMRDCLISEEDWKNRDTVIGCGNDIGSVLFAELLLYAGLPDNTINEYELEGECGFRGVAPGSAEVQLFLPGNNGWNESHWS